MSGSMSELVSNPASSGFSVSSGVSVSVDDSCSSNNHSLSKIDIFSSNPCLPLDHLLIDNIDFDNFPNSLKIMENNLFSDKAYMIKVLKLLAIKGHFQFRNKKSNKVRYTIVCKSDGCTWRFSAVSYGVTGMWIVRQFVSSHTCVSDITTTNHAQASCKVISECLKTDFQIGSVDHVTPVDIKKKIRKELKVDVSYYKAWKARKLVLEEIRGCPNESYSLLPYLADLLKEANPGTCTDYAIKDNGEFLYFFISFGASISGWPYCRPVLSVDGTFLKSEFHGTLLIACGLDGDNHIFPLAFAIVDSENNSSWEWFFVKLRSAIGDRDGLVVISDRKSSIPKAISKVYPTAHQACCMQHLLRNLKSKFPYYFLDSLFYRCATAYTIPDYELYLGKLNKLNADIQNYLEKEVGVHLWARAYFPGKRYNFMTTNISECMNAILKEARGWPVCYLILGFRTILQEWFSRRMKHVHSMATHHTIWADNIYSDYEEKAQTMELRSINMDEYEVLDGGSNYVVNIVDRTCTCRVWQLDDFPCPHAMLVMWRLKRTPRAYISPYYTKATFVSTYSFSVYPIDEKKLFQAPPEKRSLISAPTVKPKVGRPKKLRIKSVGETSKKPVRCGNCGELGHNKRKCIKK